MDSRLLRDPEDVGFDKTSGSFELDSRLRDPEDVGFDETSGSLDSRLLRDPEDVGFETSGTLELDSSSKSCTLSPFVFLSSNFLATFRMCPCSGPLRIAGPMAQSSKECRPHGPKFKAVCHNVLSCEVFQV